MFEGSRLDSQVSIPFLSNVSPAVVERIPSWNGPDSDSGLDMTTNSCVTLKKALGFSVP